VGTIYEPRTPAKAALYRWAGGRLDRMAGDVTVSNGLGFSPDGRTMVWSDTATHRIFALDFDGSEGSISRQRVLAQFAPRQPGQGLAGYGGRPDGAAVDAEGAVWVAMFEGQQLLRLAPDGQVLQSLPLPVRCPTMPCLNWPSNPGPAACCTRAWTCPGCRCTLPVPDRRGDEGPLPDHRPNAA
jgi:sugar lactone lactonase YvrE